MSLKLRSPSGEGVVLEGTEWLTPAPDLQPYLRPHSGLYALEQGFESSRDSSSWACANLTEALASIKETVDEGYGCGPGTYTGAVYTVQGTDLWVYSDDGEAYVHMVAS